MPAKRATTRTLTSAAAAALLFLTPTMAQSEPAAANAEASAVTIDFSNTIRGRQLAFSNTVDIRFDFTVDTATSEVFMVSYGVWQDGREVEIQAFTQTASVGRVSYFDSNDPNFSVWLRPGDPETGEERRFYLNPSDVGGGLGIRYPGDIDDNRVGGRNQGADELVIDTDSLNATLRLGEIEWISAPKRRPVGVYMDPTEGDRVRVLTDGAQGAWDLDGASSDRLEIRNEDDEIVINTDPVNDRGGFVLKSITFDVLPPKTEQPNVVFIYADDLGYEDISGYGSTVVDTPHIDSIGEAGFTAQDFFTASNVCSPSRSSILTGRYPMRNGVPVAVTPGSSKQIEAGYGLHTDEVTIPEVLSPVGYRSLQVGKWHLGWAQEGSHPMDQGFDANFGLKENYGTKDDRDTVFRNRDAVIRDVDPSTLTGIYTDEAVSFIEDTADSNEPFFLYFAHHIVHTPHVPSGDFVGTSDNGAYGDAIQEMDHSTGRILQALEDAGVADNTIVVFTSDNGGWLKQAADNGDFRGGKYDTMEGGHVVPAMVKWPGVIPEGITSDATITSMDFLPTLARAAGAEIPSDRVIDGQDITDLLTGQSTESPHDTLLYYNGTNLQAVRDGQWKLHLPRTAADQPWWDKFSTDGLTELDGPMLVDLNTDPGETTNVAELYPRVFNRLTADAEAARAELGDVDVIGSDQRVPPMEDPNTK